MGFSRLTSTAAAAHAIQSESASRHDMSGEYGRNNPRAVCTFWPVLPLRGCWRRSPEPLAGPLLDDLGAHAEPGLLARDITEQADALSDNHGRQSIRRTEFAIQV